MRMLRVLMAMLIVGALAAGCGYEDVELDDPAGDQQRADDEDVVEDRDYDWSVHPRVDQMDEDRESDDDAGDDDNPGTGADDDVEAGDDSEVGDPDLQCADDEDICRFCGPPGEVVTECPEDDDSFECRVFELVNEKRADHGLDELEYDGTLAESGMIHAMDLSHCDYFAHDSLDGTTFFERCEANGYPGSCTGENIGGGQSTPEDVFEAWMESPGHRDNILYDGHTELGVAYYEGDGAYGEYWLKHFGRDDG